VFGGHGGVLSEKLITQCMGDNLHFYCIPRKAAQYVFPPLHGGPLFLLKKELQAKALEAHTFIQRLKHQMWSYQAVRSYSIMRALTVTGFHPPNPRALAKFQGLKLFNNKSDSDDEGHVVSSDSDAQIISDDENQTAKKDNEKQEKPQKDKIDESGDNAGKNQKSKDSSNSDKGTSEGPMQLDSDSDSDCAMVIDEDINDDSDKPESNTVMKSLLSKQLVQPQNKKWTMSKSFKEILNSTPKPPEKKKYTYVAPPPMTPEAVKNLEDVIDDVIRESREMYDLDQETKKKYADTIRRAMDKKNQGEDDDDDESDDESEEDEEEEEEENDEEEDEDVEVEEKA